MPPDSPAGSGPRIQCSTGPFWAFELERALDAVAQAGFRDVELMVTRDPATQSPERPAELAAGLGLRIVTVHGPFLTLTKGVWGADPLAKIRRGARMCRALGATALIVHPPYLWERDYAAWLVREAPAFEAETQVAVSVETMYPRWVAGRRVRVHRWADPAELARSARRVTLDTSHVTVARSDVVATYRLLRPKLSHIHLSDNAGDGRDGHLELGRGVVPVERLLAELGATGYSGALSLELSVRRYLEREQDLVEALRRNRRYVEERLRPSPGLNKGSPTT